jgi:hypothetical protein|tara:strand:- start:1300 stop:1821 length:522 start_codon:yes stop_codon:yes gene_type:complete
MILLIITLIACVAAIARCFLTQNAKIRDLARNVQVTESRRHHDFVFTTELSDRLSRVADSFREYMDTLSLAIEALRKAHVRVADRLDERLLEIEYPAIREAQKYDLVAESMGEEEESAIDASAPFESLREYVDCIGTENLMRFDDLIKDVEKLFEQVSSTAAKVEELEEKDQG